MQSTNTHLRNFIQMNRIYIKEIEELRERERESYFYLNFTYKSLITLSFNFYIFLLS